MAKPELTMHVFLGRRVGTNPDPGGNTLEMPCGWSGVAKAGALSGAEINESATNTGIRLGSVKLTMLT